MALVISNLSKSFGRFPALNQVSLKISEGEFLALLGPSGSGKTSLLRALAGLERPDSGQVTFRGEDLLATPVRERGIGMVFQSYALFRHMTVAKNIAFGLEVRAAKKRPAKAEIANTVERLLNLVQLPDLGHRYPAQLSGGQRQRVALARALAISPRLLLLDEPFGALDAQVRKDLRRQLKRIHEETGLTTIFVTHDQTEALDLADRVAVLKDGQIQQVDTPRTLYDFPNSGFVFDFLGEGAKLSTQIRNGRACFDGYDCPIVVADHMPTPKDGQGLARFRPQDVILSETGPGHPILVTSLLDAGPSLRIEGRDEGGTLFEAEYSQQADETAHIPAGLMIGKRLRLRPRRVYVLPEGA